MFDSIVIGCGFAGAVAARELAENNKKVLIVEQRSHIGGNCFDHFDQYGILVHKYGPHIFHTNKKEVFDYLSKFTKWNSYIHQVAGNIYEKLLPIPFNLNTLMLVYGEEKGNELKKELIDTYGENAKVPILELKNNQSQDIRDIAEFVYENIFLKYTMKQWGKKPEEVDPSVTGRVPIVLSYDNRYFQDQYQGLPLEGYTMLFERLLNHENIKVELNIDGRKRMRINSEKTLLWDGEVFSGEVIYTGPLDELFHCQFGRLPYRSLKFSFEHYEKMFYQSYGVVNYTVTEDYTRITEFKHLTGQSQADGTTIVKEYPISYSGSAGEIPYYAVFDPGNKQLYGQYLEIIKGVSNFHLLGRLAEYRYYNMDGIVERALSLSKRLNRKDC